MEVFASEVQVRLAPLLVGVYDDPDQMSSEIELVSELLTDAAEKLRPCVQTQQQKSRCAKLAVRGEVVQDPELLQVCAENFQKLTKSRVESGDIVP